MRWHQWVVLIAGSTGSALRAVCPHDLHIAPDAQRDLVTPQTRRDSCNARPSPSWPRPSARVCWLDIDTRRCLHHSAMVNEQPNRRHVIHESTLSTFHLQEADSLLQRCRPARNTQGVSPTRSATTVP